MRAAVPHILTLGNLLCGVLAIQVLYSEASWEWAGWLCAIALLLDAVDGAAARALKVSGPLGKQLDSLADMVSFGVLPGVAGSCLIAEWWYAEGASDHWSSFVPLVFTLCAALRLARFNIDTEQRHFFKGLPSPAAAMVLMSLVVVVDPDRMNELDRLIAHPIFIGLLSVFLGLLMLIPQPMASIKKGPDGKLHWIVPACVSIGGASSFFIGAMGVPLGVCLYVLLSILFYRPHEVQS